MADYIKREDAKRAVWGCARDTGIDEAPFEYAEALLEDVPAEDVEPIVRCKDCKHSRNDELWHMRWCKGVTVKDEHFCADGERKDDE